MYILGISSFYHDSAAALIKDGNILFAAEEERFTRKKHDKSFPKNAISFCIKEAKISINEISQIVFYDRPFIKFERIMETAVFTAPLGYTQFHEMSKEWLSGGKLNLEDTINKELKNLYPDFSKKNNIHFCDHHLSHAASAYYPSPFKKAVILCLDGVGEWSTTTIWSAEENIIKPLALINFPHSLGLLYSAFTYFLGFKINDGEYKLMGLAPYGKAIYTDLILQNLIDVKDDGSFRLNLDYFNFTKGLTMTNEKFHQLFKIEPRNSEDQILEIHKDIARSIQEVTEIIILKMCRSLRHTYQYENLCLAGGVALNCVANGKIVEEKIFENIWVQPAAGDSGGAIGSALKYFHLDLNNPLLRGETFYDNMQGAYLGPQFSDLEIKESLDKLKANYVQLNEVEVISQTAELISQKKVIGWFQGRMEFGPRSLGSRSILADPRDKNMQSILNLKIKFRESFRPFAPAVLYQDLKKYFDLDMISPYMLFVCKTKSDIDMPSITHVDQSSESANGTSRF